MVILHYSKGSLFWSSIIFAYLSFTTVQGQKSRFQQLWIIKFLNIANIHVLDVWGKVYLFTIIRYFFLRFFLFTPFATQLFSTPVTSSNLRNQAPLFTELCLLQATLSKLTLSWFIIIWKPAKSGSTVMCLYWNIANGYTDDILTYIISMKNTNNLQITTHTTVHV